MKTISVPDMMCENCVRRITAALDAAHLTFSVDLKGKTVSVDESSNSVSIAVAELEDLGFTPEIL